MTTVESGGHPSKGLMIKRGETVLVDEAGRAYDALSDNYQQRAPSTTAGSGGGISTKKLTRRHDQSVVVDASGVAYNVRLHLAQHLQTIERVETLETTVLGECSARTACCYQYRQRAYHPVGGECLEIRTRLDK